MGNHGYLGNIDFRNRIRCGVRNRLEKTFRYSRQIHRNRQGHAHCLRCCGRQLRRIPLRCHRLGFRIQHLQQPLHRCGNLHRQCRSHPGYYHFNRRRYLQKRTGFNHPDGCCVPGRHRNRYRRKRNIHLDQIQQGRNRRYRLGHQRLQNRKDTCGIHFRCFRCGHRHSLPSTR